MSLLASLTRGFIDHTTPSPDQYLPKLVVNDRAQGKTVLANLLRHLDECEEFWFTVAFATKSGVVTLLNALQALENRGIKGRVLVSQYLDFTQPEALRSLIQLSNVTLKIATTGNFHAKGYLFNKGQHGYDLLIGSSNLTAGALKVNKEWNLQVSSSAQGDLLRSVQQVFAQEFEQATHVDTHFIIAYEQRYLANFLRRMRCRWRRWPTCKRYAKRGKPRPSSFRPRAPAKPTWPPLMRNKLGPKRPSS
jgi:HKD family nuclease